MKISLAMVTSSSVCSGPGARGQGKRTGGTVRGSMAARVLCTVEEWVPVNRENIDKHFAGIPGYLPEYIRLGTDQKLSKEKAYEHLSKLECQQLQKIT